MLAMQHAGANPCQNVGMHPAMLLHTHHIVLEQHQSLIRAWVSHLLLHGKWVVLWQIDLLKIHLTEVPALHGLKVSAARALS